MWVGRIQSVEGLEGTKRLTFPQFTSLSLTFDLETELLPTLRQTAVKPHSLLPEEHQKIVRV